MLNAILAVLRACNKGHIPPTAFELGVLGVASLLFLLLVAFGLLSLRGAMTDVISVFTGLPSTSAFDDEKDRRKSRKAVMREYRGLVLLRCLPGGLLVVIGSGWLSYSLWLGLH